NRNPPVGYKVVRLRFQNGKPAEFEDFITGFLTEDRSAQFGRPVGLAVAPDGSLLFADDTNGVIYRVSYTGS
ncbi:MAG: sorbosone dehydrogenase family protein, partial [Coleofasciculus sp. S288]|nr:sorbosone dehydrogenase family protein [Coleofasciculus sp. S288]